MQLKVSNLTSHAIITKLISLRKKYYGKTDSAQA
jgi:hypothetical protein